VTGEAKETVVRIEFKDKHININMSDLILLSQLATEAMDNETFLETTTRNQGPSPTTTGVTTRNQGPSPITTGVTPTTGQRPFVFDSSLQQAANVTPFVTQEEARQEAVRIWQAGRLSTGGTGSLQNEVQDISQGNNAYPESQSKPRGIIIPAFRTDGKFTKACLYLGTNENLVKLANTTSQLFAAWFSEDTQVSRVDRIQRIGDQLAPFPLLAVNAYDNTVAVLHGVKRFAASFGTHHPNEGDILAFKNDTNGQFKDLPQVVKIDTLDWYEATNWLRPNQKVIETTNAQFSQVVSLDASSSGISSSKIIPIPIFLVSFFMNGGAPRSALATYQAFYTEIMYNASTDLQDCLQHVQNFLIAATGAETNPQDKTKPPISQLAIKLEPVPLDQTIQPWAEHQISKMGQAAAAYDLRKSPPDNTPSPYVVHQDNRRVEQNIPGLDSQRAGMSTNAGTQQYGLNSAGTTSFVESSLNRQMRPGNFQNENSAQYLDYVPERGRVANVQNTNVGHQQSYDHTNYNPAVGFGERFNTLPEGISQQGQFGNGQSTMAMHHNNAP